MQHRLRKASRIKDLAPVVSIAILRHRDSKLLRICRDLKSFESLPNDEDQLEDGVVNVELLDREEKYSMQSWLKCGSGNHGSIGYEIWCVGAIAPEDRCHIVTMAFDIADESESEDDDDDSILSTRVTSLRHIDVRLPFPEL